jgi:hypothetical protein
MTTQKATLPWTACIHFHDSYLISPKFKHSVCCYSRYLGVHISFGCLNRKQGAVHVTVLLGAWTENKELSMLQYCWELGQKTRSCPCYSTVGSLDRKQGAVHVTVLLGAWTENKELYILLLDSCTENKELSMLQYCWELGQKTGSCTY